MVSVPPDALEAELSAERDADERQDEILANAGQYDLPLRAGLRWKVLVVLGVIVTLLGFVFWLNIGGLRVPDVSSLPWALGSLMAMFLAVLGLICLIVGIVLGARYRRDPYEMEPIR